MWTPSAEQVASANVTRFIREVVRPLGGAAIHVHDSVSLHAWSIAEPEQFWPAVWRFTGVIADERVGSEPWDRVLTGGGRMAPPDPVDGPNWFPGARLNFAENLLRFQDERDALVLWTEQGAGRRLTYAELAREVASFAAFLRASGVVAGDRVAAFVPNVPEAVVAMLASASIGAIWSSCSPDFGVAGVVDRFGQIAPRVLIAADGYRYGGRTIESVERVREFSRSLPSVEMQERKFRRLGGRTEQSVDVRVIAATNIDPAAAIRDGRLREDLYYRLNVFTIKLPPLRDHKDDLPLLIQAFIDEFNTRDHRTVRAVAPAAMRLLEQYDWPGNVRELRNVIERATILARGDVIEPAHLPTLGAPAVSAVPANGLTIAPGMTVDQAEQKLIVATLDAAAGNKTRAADMLGISLKTLHNKLNRFKEAGASGASGASGA